jgi:hypothetical protein
VRRSRPSRRRPGMMLAPLGLKASATVKSFGLCSPDTGMLTISSLKTLLPIFAGPLELVERVYLAPSFARLPDGEGSQTLDLCSPVAHFALESGTSAGYLHANPDSEMIHCDGMNLKEPN